MLDLIGNHARESFFLSDNILSNNFLFFFFFFFFFFDEPVSRGIHIHFNIERNVYVCVSKASGSRLVVTFHTSIPSRLSYLNCLCVLQVEASSRRRATAPR